MPSEGGSSAVQQAVSTELAALAALSRRLNGAVSMAEVAGIVVDGADAVVGASFANVAIVDPDAHCLRLVSPATLDVEIEQRWSVLPLEGDATTFHDAYRTGEPVFVAGTEERRALYPELVEDTIRAGLEATAALPLRDGTGEVFALLGIGWPRRVELTPALRARLDLLADLCAQAMERTRRTGAQDRLVHLLRDELLGYLDTPTNLDVAVGYQPAGTELGFGGDWYDVIALSQHETAFVVGDVAGHGVPAAAHMAVAKASIRALTLTSPSLDVVLPLATRSLAHLGTAYVATAVIAVVDTRARTLRCTAAGHPPPVLRRPDRPAHLVWGTRHPPIGMGARTQPIPEEPFPPGSLLVIYSDGLVERRSAAIDDRIDRLRAVIDGLPGETSARSTRDALIAELVDDETSDDVAIIVVHHR